MNAGWWMAVIFGSLLVVALFLVVVMEHAYDEAREQWRGHMARAEAAEERAERAEGEVKRLKADLFRERVEHGRTPSSRVALLLELRRDLEAWNKRAGADS